MKQMNLYFFGDPEICLSDALYFYGINIAIMLIIVLGIIVRF